MSLGDVVRQRRQDRDLTQDYVATRVGISKPYLSNIETCRATKPPSDKIVRALERVLGFAKGDLSSLAALSRTPLEVRRNYELLEAEVVKLRAVVREFLAKGPRTDAGGVDLEAMARDASEDGVPVRAVAAGPTVPIINKVVAGYPVNFTDMDYPPGIAEDYVRCPDVHDPHAFGARVIGDSMEPTYHEGDIVIFTPNRPPQSGEDCFVRFIEDMGTTFKRYYQDQEGFIRLQPLNSKYPAEAYPREKITGLWPLAYRIQKVHE